MVPAANTPERRAIVALAFLLIPFFTLVFIHWGWAPAATSGDYAQYLLHARAIVEGRSYSDIGYIYQPAAGLIGPPALPPGLPLALAPLVALDGPDTPLVRLLTIGFVVGFAVLAAWRLSRVVEPWQAALGAAFAAFAIETSLASVAPLSDPGFAVLLWATIAAVDREGPWSLWRVAGVTALGFAAISFRLVGIALVPALLMFALLHRQRFGFRPFIPVAIWTTAGAVAVLTGAVRVPFTERIPLSGDEISEHLRTFVRQYRTGLFDALLYPFSSDTANDVYHLVAAALVLLGLAIILWRERRTFLVATAAAYTLLLLVAPVAEPRYAWPLFPLVGAALAKGTALVMRPLLRSMREAARARATGLPLVTLLLLALVREGRRDAPPSLVRHPDASALFAWLSARQDSALRVAFHNPRVLTLKTRVPAMGIVPRNAPGQMAALAESRATHFVWQAHGLGTDSVPGKAPCVQRMANQLPELYPEQFTLAYSNGTFRVYRVKPGDARAYTGIERISWNRC